jgi:hypothetical protein
MRQKNPDLSKTSRVIKRSKLGVVKSGMLQPFAVISRFQKDFGLTQPVVVRMTGYSPRSVASWSKGVKATEPARRKFTELVRLFDALADLMENPKEVAEWLQEPNSAFDGSTPLQVIERGETDRLWRMIYTLESGDPG